MMNRYQVIELLHFVKQHHADEAVAVDFGEKPDPVVAIKAFDCQVPGMLAVHTKRGGVVRLLYPTPRPVPKDPQFQHATGINGWQRVMVRRVVDGRRDLFRDWAWDGVLMDAPDTMPAGACEYFCHDVDVYGAQAMTMEREQ